MPDYKFAVGDRVRIIQTISPDGVPFTPIYIGHTATVIEIDNDADDVAFNVIQIDGEEDPALAYWDDELEAI